MSKLPLRLLVDPPYPGESLSSFLGRTAQMYCQSVPDLLYELTQQVAWHGGRRDIDRWPPDQLLSMLADAVPGWRSPLADWVGFRGWVVAPKVRHAYCPTCFVGDLGMERVPYFRQDWMAVLTTSCWKHGTPLCQWQRAKSAYRRQLPTNWVFQSGFGEDTYPAFFQADLDRLHTLRNGSEAGAKAPDLGQALSLLRHFQTLLEKPATDPMPTSETRLVREIWAATRRLILLAVSFARTERETGPPAAYLRPTLFGDWFGSRPLWLGPRQYEFRENALRLGGEVSWRRTYLWFAARTLAGCEPFASRLFKEFQPWEPWEEWWDRAVRPLCPSSFRLSIDLEANFLKQQAARYCRD